MAEFTSAEKVNIGYENEYSTDAMTGGPDGIYWKVPSSFPIAEIARPLQVSVVSFSHAASNSDHVVGTSTPASSNIDLL